jgi:hypothetical protein
MAGSYQARQSHRHVPWRIWANWVLVGTLSGALIGGMSVKLDFFAPLLLLLLLSAAQAAVLRRHLPIEARWLWIGASLVGWLLGTPLMVQLRFSNPLTQDSRSAIIFALHALDESIVMAAVGTAQWLVLRRHWRRAGWWIVASAIGGAVAGVLSIMLCWTYCQALPFVFGLASGSALSLGVAWAGYSAVTGVVIAQLISGGLALPSPRDQP